MLDAPPPAGLPFTSRLLLAPMEGVTDPAFRGLVLSRHRPDELGGAFTEFARVNADALGAAVLRRHLGAAVNGIPVGLQLMGQEPLALARTAERAAALGAPLIDLNFGCPARGAWKTCAGSALLDHPRRIEELVAACVTAVAGRVPVSAKIRAGVRDDRGLEDVVAAAEAGGAALITIHCRTRSEGYDDRAIDWRRVTRAVAATRLPVCGNGGVGDRVAGERMMAATGCALVMIGRAALGDPFCFRRRPADAAEAGQFLLDYAAAMTPLVRRPRQALARLKQLLRHWRAGGLVRDEDERRRLLHESDLETVLAFIHHRSGIPTGARPGPAGA
ncbi:MAG: tRNA-dihydrouridine synthase family protein [Planctomycetes bacterium]|nr:tRNA-dihydrouridine synthase family protein [Planctomycetota bacterium]